ncbi:ABC transporter substrate-binding protein [Mechercharimyces sp. CAU 1602]|uniref:ABC transporter substrate-binding protein n=1 Tax=Mechercharimyces sp. CAU 1602 TaxID=2973933 RepID=UPI002162215A|nr:ABC transporter substrate-binding protein [Mechercharimyces sp. CAU 1602]MCS1351463.1 ABC transporter substrate-binding protein [Mechercharimyces sp. CAU 1602]
MITRPLRWAITLTILCLLALSLFACSPTDQDEIQTIRVVEVTHSLFYAPQYIAMEKGFFQDEGIQIELLNGAGGDKTMTTLLSGEADIILMGQEGAVYVTAREANEPIVAFAQLTQRDGSFLVARTQTSTFNWSDLRNQTLLGQRKGGMPQMVSEHVQRINGLHPHKDVSIIQNIEFQHLGTAFASGTGDYVQLFEPIASQLEEEGKGYVVASFGEETQYLPYTVYLSKQSWLQSERELAVGFTRALYRAQQWMTKHSAEEIADIVAPQFPETDPTIVEKVIQRYKLQDVWAPTPVIEKEEYDHMIKIMNEAGELPKAVPYESVTNSEIAEEVIKK